MIIAPSPIVGDALLGCWIIVLLPSFASSVACRCRGCQHEELQRFFDFWPLHMPCPPWSWLWVRGCLAFNHIHQLTDHRSGVKSSVPLPWVNFKALKSLRNCIQLTIHAIVNPTSAHVDGELLLSADSFRRKTPSTVDSRGHEAKSAYWWDCLSGRVFYSNKPTPSKDKKRGKQLNFTTD